MEKTGTSPIHERSLLMKNIVLAVVVACVGCAAWAEVDSRIWCRFDAAAPLADSSGQNKPLTLAADATGVRFVKGLMRLDAFHTALGYTLPDVDVCTNLTIEMFVRPDWSKGWGMRGSARVLLSQPTNHGKAQVLTFKSDRRHALYASTQSAGSGTTADGVFHQGVWHHIAYTVDTDKAKMGGDSIHLYVDGVNWPLDGTGTPAGFLRQDGWAPCGGSYTAFTGDFDEYRVSAAILSPSEFIQIPTIDGSTPPAGAKVWKGGMGLPDWNVASNWEGNAVPAAGDTVFIRAGRNCVVSSSTPALAKLIVEGTLVCSNWNTKVTSTDIVVQNTGVITAWDAFTTDDDKCRVWLVCENLTVDETGAIDVGACGWQGGNQTVSNGYGPSGALVGSNAALGQRNSTMVPGHGGVSAFTGDGRPEYDSPEAPVEPGSGGGHLSGLGEIGTAGGGAVRIEATGTVTVNGRISADAEQLNANDMYNYASAGSGGSVWITCRKLAGTNGRITADGAHATADRPVPAGGRIAVHYDTSVQTAADVSHVFFSAVSGRIRPSGAMPVGHARQERYDTLRAGAGTIWFPDAKLVHAGSLGTDFAGRLGTNVTTVTTAGDLTVTNWVGFMADGFKLTVNGNLNLVGPDGRLDFGVGQIADIPKCFILRYEPRLAPELKVAGNFTMGESTRLDVFSAPSEMPFGAFVTVGGHFSVAANSYVYPFSSLTNGASVAFDVGSFTLAEGGVIGLTGSGFGSGHSGQNGYGPGGAIACMGTNHEKSSGAGHGGRGAANADRDDLRGVTYDQLLWPILAGSGGSIGSWSNPQAVPAFPETCGGGVFRLCCKGKAVVNGTIDMSAGVQDWSYTYGYYRGGGSGGSILIDCRKFEGGASAVLKADGASVHAKSGNEAAGGGGRIAIWRGLVKPVETLIRESTAAMETPFETFLGTVSAANGTDKVGTAEVGTIRFITVSGGMVIFLR